MAGSPGNPVTRVVVVIPAHDEREGIRACVDSVLAAAAEVDVPVTVRVVLDTCTDGTGEHVPDGVETRTVAVRNVGAARAAMAKQTGLDKKTVLNVRPAFLIVPASLELKAEQLVAQNLVPAATSSVVPQSIRTLAPISEPRLDAASETAWYLAASPNQIDTIEYAYLEGQQGAYIETRNGFDVDGVEIKCRLDFGAKAIDWRGLYKNPGA